MEVSFHNVLKLTTLQVFDNIMLQYNMEARFLSILT